MFAIVTATAAFHVVLAFVIAFGVLALTLILRRCHRNICRRSDADRSRRLGLDQPKDVWGGLPPKWNPTGAESHLGKSRLGERSAA
jgi:hypothetical protein